LGELVASVMRGIESQMGWSFLAASAAVLSVGLGFAIWSCYSDGAKAWEARHVRSQREVVQLRAWIALHFPLFLGIGVLGVGLRRAIALPTGGHFSEAEQWIICSATASIILVIMGIALTSEHHGQSRILVAQVIVAACALAVSPFCSQIIATALLAILLSCIITQSALLVTNRRYG
jgi:low temperature requirement protein LtrA